MNISSKSGVYQVDQVHIMDVFSMVNSKAKKSVVFEKNHFGEFGLCNIPWNNKKWAIGTSAI